MEITWFGLSCFRIRSRSMTIITDPYDRSTGIGLPRMRADIVTVSMDTPDRNAIRMLDGDPVVFGGPGEYEVGGVFIIGMDIRPAGQRGRSRNERNTVFLFEPDGWRICHLGGIRHVPDQSDVEELIGKVDVLLVPVGGGEVTDPARAAEIVSLLEPRIVIPMHYRLPGLNVRLEPVEKFLKEMGVRKTAVLDALKITREELPEETQVVILNPNEKITASGHDHPRRLTEKTGTGEEESPRKAGASPKAVETGAGQRSRTPARRKEHRGERK